MQEAIAPRFPYDGRGVRGPGILEPLRLISRIASSPHGVKHELQREQLRGEACKWLAGPSQARDAMSFER